MNGDNWLVVIDELVECEKITGSSSRLQENHPSFRGIYKMYPKLTKITERCQHLTGRTWNH